MKADVQALLSEVRSRLVDLEELSDLTVKKEIESVVLEAKSSDGLTINEKKDSVQYLFNRLRRYDVLQPLLDDETITEIMINGPECIFIERAGKLMASDVKFESSERLETVVQQIVSEVNRQVNRASPIADARLSDGSRVNVVMPPIALDGAAVTIRKFSKSKLSMTDLVQGGALNDEMARFLERVVKARFNILICGGTGCGKTTLLNILSDAIPEDERVVTIEDSAELKLKSIKNLIRMEARQNQKEIALNVTIKDLIKASLRMRPDRIIVGEVRGAETLDMLQAMNTGHEGSITTGHSNSGKDMLIRLETMILAGEADIPVHSIRSQIASGLDLVVFLRRYKDGVRRIESIEEIDSLKEGRISTRLLYRYSKNNGFMKVNEVSDTWKFETNV